MKNKSLILGIIASAVLISIWASFVDLNQMLFYFKQIKPFYALLGGFVYLLAYVFRAIRWQQILSPIKKISAINAFYYWIAGNFLNYLIPIRAGELARAYFIKKNHKSSITETLPSVFIDKIFDLFGIFVIIIMLPFFGKYLPKQLWALIIALFCVVFVAGAILLGSVLAHNKLSFILKKLMFFLPIKIKNKFNSFIERFLKGCAYFKNHKFLLLKAAFLTVVAILLDSIFFMFMFKAFGQQIPYLYVLFGYTLIYLSYILPHPPAQVGSNELIMILIFAVGFGFDKNMVSSVMTFSHLLTGIVLSLSGILGFSMAGVKFLEPLKNKNKME